MSSPIARVGDSASGVCGRHRSSRAWTGTISSGSDILRNDGIPVARVGDIGTTSCGHQFRIIQGSTILTDRGIRVSRVGDAVEIIDGPGSGTITSGSSNFKSA